MTEKSELDTQSLYAIRRASIEAAKALLDKTQEDGQVRVVAEKIAIQAMGVAIAQSQLMPIDGPNSHRVAIRGPRNGELSGSA
jgi:hypothetical protein